MEMVIGKSSSVDKDVDLTNLQWFSGERKVHRLAPVAVSSHPPAYSRLVEKKDVDGKVKEIVIKLKPFGIEGLSMRH